MTHHASAHGGLASFNDRAMNRPPRRDADGLRSYAEGLLREVAFVLHASRSVRAAMTQGRADAAPVTD